LTICTSGWISVAKPYIMGSIVSSLVPSGSDSPPSVVLVPPKLIPREGKGRSRFSKSGYDTHFRLPLLRELFDDYLHNDRIGILRFSPPEEDSMHVTAKLRNSSFDNTGSITLRYQPIPALPYTFFDVKARTSLQNSTTATAAAARGCVLFPCTNMAIFGTLPLTSPFSRMATSQGSSVPIDNMLLGMRYASPLCSAGVIINPAYNKLQSAWAVVRSGPVMIGMQTSPWHSLDGIFSNRSTTTATTMESSTYSIINPSPINELWKACTNTSSIAMAYTSEGARNSKKGGFTAIIELRNNQQHIALSFLHHIAMQRAVKNPLEKGDVVGITNYLDVGLEMVVDTGSGSGYPATTSSSVSSSQPPTMRLGASWQANKNTLLKARAGLDGVAASFILRSWWQPAFTLGLAVSSGGGEYGNSYSNNDRGGGGGGGGGLAKGIKWGITMKLESWESLRYERSPEGMRMTGSKVTQRHVAGPEDLETQGLLVSLDKVNDPLVLGQEQTTTGADYM